MKHSRANFDGGILRMPRSRGAVTGLLLVLLGAWGALIPFIGPHFNFAFTPDQEWTWTAARGWLEVLPGITTAVGGLLLLCSGNRATAMFGGWLAVFAGAWFVVGRAFSTALGIGYVGSPVASTDIKWALLAISYFSGLGVLIVFLGGAALARLLVRHARDVKPIEPAAAAEPLPAPQMSAYGMSAYDVPPEVMTHVRTEQFAAPKPESHRHFGPGLFRGMFRRRHVNAGG